MAKNTGLEFEEKVYKIVTELVQSNRFLLSNPYVKVCFKKPYFSQMRNAYIIFDITVEKYLEDPEQDETLRPAIVVVIECKDYSGAVPVDDVEEFHFKLEQIGADYTKGIMITRNGCFQEGAYNVAKSTHITLARILPDDQVHYILHKVTGFTQSNSIPSNFNPNKVYQALTEQDFESIEEKFYSYPCASSLESLVQRLLDI